MKLTFVDYSESFELTTIVENCDGQDETEEEEEEEDGKKQEVIDVHTFVALIDIIFTDFSKRTCTGTIIHDNVVITAAHCFNVVGKTHVQPELTASFVVIGTKKMFDTKYEQYLPIERVITHPHYKGWTADIALVYTFSGMTSDKPGTIIQLDGEKTSTPVDSNVTVLSWGVCLDDDRSDNRVTEMDKSNYEAEKGDCDSDGGERLLRSQNKPKEGTAVKNRYPMGNENTRVESSYREANRETDRGSAEIHWKELDVPESTTLRHRKPLYQNPDRYPEMREHRYDLDETSKPVTRTTTPPYTTRYQSRYLSSGEKEAEIKIFKESSQESQSSSESEWENTTKGVHFRADEDYNTRKTWFKPRTKRKYGYKSLYHNWRRSMGTQQNKLTVDVFGFVNMQACKKMVERAMPALYEIGDNNDIVCYASEEHYITTEDSGAPAIRSGHLVAVTMGGVECDGDHVAIGMKMSCYCSWIVGNLPPGAPKMKCCKNCCDLKFPEVRAPGRSHYHKKHIGY